MATIENATFQFNNDLNSGQFNIYSQNRCFPDLIKNKLEIVCKSKIGKRFSFDLPLKDPHLPMSHLEPGARSLQFSGVNREFSISWQVIFNLAAQDELIRWKITLTNKSHHPVFIDKIFFLKPAIENNSNLKIDAKENKPDYRFFSNGWQSWSYSGAYQANERMRRSKLGILQTPMVFNPGTPQYKEKGKFSSDFFAAIGDRSSDTGLVLGFLSQKQNFGSITADLRRKPWLEIWANGDHVRLDPGISFTTDWFVCGLCEPDNHTTLKPYLDAVAREHNIVDLPHSLTGWCSWYYYYQNISREKIKRNIRAIDNKREILPLDLIQIDDGFQKQVGDWLEFDNNFPEGVKDLATSIRNRGFIPGIWLAPFILHPRSKLAKEHPEWLLRKENGKLSRAGFVWNSLALALDLTVPGVLEYVCKVIGTAVHEWGFTYLKLDFLYAAALDGKYHDDTKTRAQVLREGMKAIRAAAGEETILLGCGAPLGSVLGIVESMRIGADVSGHWKPTYFNLSLPFKNEPCMPSAENSIHNVITRSFLHNSWWVNDPDCLLVGEGSALSVHEAQTLASAIGITGGSFLISDNMETLSEKGLIIARTLIPPIQSRVRVLDWMDSKTPTKMRVDFEGAVGSWHLISFSNWENVPVDVIIHAEDFNIENADYVVSSFWKESSWKVAENTSLFSGELAAHETLLLAVRKKMNTYQFMGSNLHFSQGLEIAEMAMEKKILKISFSTEKQLSGYVEFLLPKKPKTVKLDSSPVRWSKTEVGSYRFYFDDIKPGKLVISFE